MMRNKIILIGGYCATGKTSFSHMLSQELNIPCFNKDIIDETMCDGFGSDSGIADKGSEDVAFHLMLHIAERFLQTEKVCILENNYVLEEIEKIKILLDKYNCECLLYILKSDLDVMFDRYVERDKSGERHWIHKPAGDKNRFKNLNAVMFGLEEVEIGEKIYIDTTSFEKVDYDALLTIAKRFIKNN